MEYNTMSNEQNPINSILHKKSALFLLCGFLLAIFAVAYYVSTLNYENAKEEILSEESITQTTWVQGTVQAVTLWAEAVDEQAQRVSVNPVYTQFLQDVITAGDDVASEINTLDTRSIEIGSSYEYFLEQIPFLRDALYDFMLYNNMLDARIVDANAITILSGLQIPSPITDNQINTVLQAIENDHIAFGPVRTSAATMVIDYALAIPPVDGSDPFAALLLTAPITNQIAQFLSREIRSDSERLPHIIQKVGDEYQNIQVQTPQPTTINVPLDFDEAGVLPFAIRQSISTDGEVYSYGEKIPGLDMYVVIELPAETINTTFSSLAWTIYGLGVLASVGVTLLFALLWWMMIGTEQKAAATRFRNLYSVINQQKGLLDSINLSLEVGLILVDAEGTIKIANKTFSEIVGKCTDDVENSSLLSMFEAQLAGTIMSKVNEVIETASHCTFEIEVPKNDENFLFRVTMYPFKNDAESDQVAGAVATLQDITAFRRNSEKNKKQQANIIQAFVRAIEGIDPYLTGHSQMMSNIGVLMSKHLNMSDEEIAAVRDASIFSQIGKLFVDREILTKTGKLTDEELKAIRQIPQHAYEVLSGIGFAAPIAKAVWEMYEQVDGNGYPKGLKGDDIILQARILAITNSFCAMISERSFRAGLPISDAIARLKSDSNKFDSQLVDVLTEVINTPEGAQALIVDKS